MKRKKPRRQCRLGLELLAPPRGDEPVRENRANGDVQNENTTESTTPAAMFAECMQQHLTDQQLQLLVEHLNRPSARQHVSSRN